MTIGLKLAWKLVEFNFFLKQNFNELFVIVTCDMKYHLIKNNYFYEIVDNKIKNFCDLLCMLWKYSRNIYCKC